MIQFITNLDPAIRSGGFSALNAATCEAVGRRGPTNLIDSVNPAPSRVAHILSKGRRLLGLGGSFFYFSDERLRRIATEVESRVDPSATLDFFHGFTPWTLTQPQRPYLALSDCLFHDYVRIYHHVDRFDAADIVRIEDAERDWLNRAERVLFTSRWGACRAQEVYGLPDGKIGVVGLFGEMAMPDSDSYDGSPSFLFVSTHFQAKGGHAVLEAFKRVRRRHPKALLTVVGDAKGFVAAEGVTHAGFLHKEIPEEEERLRALFASARAVVHPTLSDILPHLLIEAGYFGVPAITSDLHAIGEYIDHGTNGLLLNNPRDVEKIAAAMESILDGKSYRSMRLAAWKRSREGFSREGFLTRVESEVNEAIARLKR